MDPHKVALILAAFDGAFSGVSLSQRISSKVREDGVIDYDLIDWDAELQEPTGRVEHYEVRVTPIEVTVEERDDDVVEVPDGEQSAQEV